MAPGQGFSARYEGGVKAAALQDLRCLGVLSRASTTFDTQVDAGWGAVRSVNCDVALSLTSENAPKSHVDVNESKKLT
jgi:hypothetical protein